MTVLVGAGIDERRRRHRGRNILENHVHDHHPGTELVTYHTGHRGDALLIGVE